MRNDPQVARTTERWLHPSGYIEKLLMGNEDQMRRTEYSPNNHFMYWVDRRPRNARREERKTLQEARKEGKEDVHAGFGRGDQSVMKESIRQIEQYNELKNQLEDDEKGLADKLSPEDKKELKDSIGHLIEIFHKISGL